MNDILTEEVATAIQAPIEEARTLPRKAFTSEAFLEAERSRIFAGGWVALYFMELLPKPGDAVPLDLAGMPLLALRDQEDVVRVFHNIVPYDGCLALIDPAEGLDEIRAPYHGWRYSLKGKLLATPYWGGTVDGTDLSPLGDRPADLVEVATATWGPVLFVNLASDPEPFSELSAPLDTALGGWDLGALAISRSASGTPILYPEDLATNWKTHLENWGINVLHEAFVHNIYNQSPEVPRMREDGVRTYEDYVDGPFMALRYLEADFPNTYGEIPFPRLDRDPANPTEHGYFGTFMPNLHFGVFGNLLHLIISNPVSPGRTTTLRAQFYHSSAASSDEYAEAREFLAQGFVEAGSEDGRITEAVQKARQSPAFPSQFYSQNWDTMHYRFTQWVLAQLTR